MTTARIVRGTKARIFLYLCAILIVTGIIACYNNTLSQLEDTRKSSEICRQQEENLSTQLQVISDYKQSLEKSLKTEKAEHQQMKADLESKLTEEKSKNERNSGDSHKRFSALQQQYNILQTTHDDFKEETIKNQSKQQKEVHELQAKLHEVQEELKKMNSSKEKIKSEYLQILVEQEQTQKELKLNSANNGNHQFELNKLEKANHDLQRELDEIKNKVPGFDSLQAPNVGVESSSARNVNFDKQLQISPNEYQIRSPNKTQSETFMRMPSKATSSSSLKVSQGDLNRARPLIVPTMTPIANTSKPYMKIPNGVVVPLSEKFEIEKKTDEDANDTFKNRYHKMNDVKEVGKKVDDVDKEDGAHEELDPRGIYDALAFGDNANIEANKNSKQFNKHHIDNLGIGEKDGNDYKDQNELQLEEAEAEDDDADDYRDRLGGFKDAVVRN